MPAIGIPLIKAAVWIIFGGIWIALSHLILGLAFAITIVGIPFAQKHFRLASVALTPFGVNEMRS